jgi:predicted kinase
VIVMGIPGAGKTRIAHDYAERGYERLNRDERGGSLRALAAALDDRLGAGARRVVLDNTYLTRAARSHVVDAAARHGLPVRCVWLRTPLAQAQVNMVERLLERFGALPTPEELRQAARREPWLLAPTAQMRALRELEPPAPDEGFAAVEARDFARAAPADGKGGVLVAAAVLARPAWREAIAAADPTAPHLVFDWAPQGGDAVAAGTAHLAEVVSGPVEGAACPHPGGPPRCWCRPPLPGLPLAFCRAHGLDPARSTVVGTAAAHRTLAAALGARYSQA